MKNSASLLITTYNWKEALSKVLESVLTQTYLPKEVVVADDGSNQDTAELIERYQAIFPVPLIHCWQEDQGFRAAAIRNQAIARMTADYVIMIDGDMLLHPQFIQDHIRAAKSGFFIQGSRVITSPKLAASILDGRQLPRHYPLRFFSSGISNRINTLNSPLLSRFLSRVDCDLRSTKTCNFSAWRKDILSINGFNEDFVGWGREDSDLVARLFHAKRQRLRLKCMANAYHLYHDDNSRDRLSENDVLLEQCLQRKQTWCVNGIDKYIA